MKKTIIILAMILILATSASALFAPAPRYLWFNDYNTYNDTAVNPPKSDLEPQGSPLLMPGEITNIGGMVNLTKGNADFVRNQTIGDVATIKTIVLWAYFESVGGGDTQGLFALDAGTSDFFRFYKANSGDNLRLELRIGGTDVIAGEVGTITAGQWTHFAVVRNTSGYYVLGNATQMYTNAATNATTSAMDYLEIGDVGSWTTLTMNGRISQFAIFNYSLTYDNITTLYNTKLGNNITGGSGGAPPAPPTNYNFTFQIHSAGLNVTTYNATIENYVFYTTNATIITNYTVNDTNIKNITINALGFDTTQLTNIEFNVSPRNFTINYTNPTNINITGTTGQYRTGNNISLICEYDQTGGLFHNSTFYINNTIDGIVRNQNSTTNATVYTFLPSDFLDKLKFWCEPKSNYGSINSTDNETIQNNTIDTLVNISGVDYLGNLLNQMRTQFVNITTNYTTNPIQTLLSDFLNMTTKTYNMTVIAYDPSNLNLNLTTTILFNETNKAINLTFEPTLLIMNFTVNGKLNETEGYLVDINYGVTNFTNETVFYYQANLSEDIIRVRFNYIAESWTNHTQYFEYINDYTPIKAQFELLQDGDWSFYVQVLTESGTPIENAQVNAQWASLGWANLGIWKQWHTLGQRLTDGEGKTFFFTDKDTEQKLTIYKEGYDLKFITLPSSDYTYTEDNPLKIYLTESTGISDGNVWLYVTPYVYNLTETIKGTIVAPRRDKVEFTTDYRIDGSLSTYDITEECDNFMQCNFQLQSGKDFDNTGGNISLIIYIDDELWKNQTIEFRDRPRNHILTIPTNIEDKYLVPIIGILLFLISAGIPFLLSSPTAGITTFYILGIISVLISTQYIWVSLICLIKFALTTMHKISTE